MLRRGYLDLEIHEGLVGVVRGLLLQLRDPMDRLNVRPRMQKKECERAKERGAGSVIGPVARGKEKQQTRGSDRDKQSTATDAARQREERASRLTIHSAGLASGWCS
eukprot:1975078-Rhodomonas_salina.3